MEVIANKISKKSLFKLLLVGLGFGFLAFFIVCGIAAMFGAETIRWNNTPVTGFSGLLLAIAMWPFFSLIFTGFIWVLSVFGLWFYSFFKPLKVVFKEVMSPCDTVE